MEFRRWVLGLGCIIGVYDFVVWGVHQALYLYWSVAHHPGKQRHLQADEREPDACGLAAGFAGFLLRSL